MISLQKVNITLKKIETNVFQLDEIGFHLFHLSLVPEFFFRKVPL